MGITRLITFPMYANIYMFNILYCLLQHMKFYCKHYLKPTNERLSIHHNMFWVAVVTISFLVTIISCKVGRSVQLLIKTFNCFFPCYRISIPLILSLPATVLSLTSKDQLKVCVFSFKMFFLEYHSFHTICFVARMENPCHFYSLAFQSIPHNVASFKSSWPSSYITRMLLLKWILDSLCYAFLLMMLVTILFESLPTYGAKLLGNITSCNRGQIIGEYYCLQSPSGQKEYKISGQGASQCALLVRIKHHFLDNVYNSPSKSLVICHTMYLNSLSSNHIVSIRHSMASHQQSYRIGTLIYTHTLNYQGWLEFGIHGCTSRIQ